MELTFTPASGVDPSAWDSLVDVSPDGWVFALSGWQRLILAVSEWGLRDLSFAARSGPLLVGVMPLQFQPSGFRAGSSGWGLAGPVVSGGLSATERAEVRSAMLSRAESLAVNAGATAIEIGRSPVTVTSRTDLESSSGFTADGYEDVSTRTMIVSLETDEADLWRALSKNARQMVRRATSLGYEARRGHWPALVDDYYRVHSETYHRTDVHPHPRAYLGGIASEMAPRGNAVLWAGYSPDGRPIAFHNDARFGPGALYHTGCSETAHLDSGINYLLMWEAIRGAKADGCRWYEVGEVFPEAREGKSRGLTVFKSKFGGDVRRSIKARRVLRNDSDVPAPAARPDSDAEARKAVRDAYEQSPEYDVSRICRSSFAESDQYVDRLLHERLALVAEFCSGGRVVDLCCGAGVHAVEMADRVKSAIGVDFSTPYLREARELAASQGRRNVSFVQADAGRLPLASDCADFLYCFSSLYAIPNADDVVAEIGRVLKPRGRAVLDFGNRRSISFYCSRHYTDWAPIYPLTIGEIRRALQRAGLRELRHRRFQVLPLWADRPKWLKPLLHPYWAQLLKRRVGSRMLDEWVSSLPILRAFAFRHVIVCQKTR